MEQARLIKFLIFWIVISITINLSSSAFGRGALLGNSFLSASMAAGFTGLILTVLYYEVPFIVKNLKFKVEGENQWALVFFAANLILILILKIFYFVTGINISYLVIPLVAAAVTLTERIVDKVWVSTGFR